ncbi:DUF1353 domain-containing protein [Ensifer sp. MPMI2T]|nr:DUF1353 domain-containing protein [Ensifer sp. MPMI2T]
MRSTITGLFAICLSVSNATAQPDVPERGPPVQFQGRLVGEFLDDGRKIRLLETYTYLDPVGQVWTVPADTVVDGASIPQIFWSVIGGPLEGKYRNASVIHDFYCDQKTRPWQSVHRVFFDAMQESGVEALKAKIMYYAVYTFGPRWETITTNTVALQCSGLSGSETCETVLTPKQVLVELPPPEYDAEQVKKDVEFILSRNPDLKQIEDLAP